MHCFAQTLELKDDPRLIAEYLTYHEKVWPEVRVSQTVRWGVLIAVIARSFRCAKMIDVDFTGAGHVDDVVQKIEQKKFSPAQVPVLMMCKVHTDSYCVC